MAFTANTPQLHLIGEIRGATGFEADRLFCRYEFRVGHNWTLMGGKDTGETYEEIRDGVVEESVWDHPFDLHYKCKAIRGWPKIFVEVCQANA
jgi:B9 domain-containing protein 2